MIISSARSFKRQVSIFWYRIRSISSFCHHWFSAGDEPYKKQRFLCLHPMIIVTKINDGSSHLIKINVQYFRQRNNIFTTSYGTGMPHRIITLFTNNKQNVSSHPSFINVTPSELISGMRWVKCRVVSSPINCSLF